MALTDRLDAEVDAAIDFSAPAATLALAAACVERGTALVVGTTGLEPEQRAELERPPDRSRC